MASDPEELPDAPPLPPLPHPNAPTQGGGQFLASYQSPYQSPYSSNTSSLYPVSQTLGVAVPDYSTQPRPPVQTQTTHYRYFDSQGRVQTHNLSYISNIPSALPVGHLQSPVVPTSYTQSQPQPQTQYVQHNPQNIVQPQAQVSPYSYQTPKELPPRSKRKARAPARSKSQKSYLPYIQPNNDKPYSSPYQSAPLPQVMNTAQRGGTALPFKPSGSLGYAEQSRQVWQPALKPSSVINNTLSSHDYVEPAYSNPSQQMLQPEVLRTPSNAVPSTSFILDESGGYSPSGPSFSSPNFNILHPETSGGRDMDSIIEGVLRKQMSSEEVGTDSEKTDDDVGFRKAFQVKEKEANKEPEENVEPEQSGDESDFLDGSDILSRDDGEISDTDSVFQDYDKNISELRKEVYKVREIYKDPGAKAKNKKVVQQIKPRRGGVKGPRKIAELSGDIRMRLSRATQFFLQQNYHEARKEVQLIIKINAEVYQAYSLLASIFREWGDFDEELLAMQSCCHFMPKEEAGVSWLTLARRIDEASYEMKQKHLASGVYCCSQALKTLRNNVEALCLKANFNRDMNRIRTAKGEFELALKADPHNPKAMRGLAACHLDDEKPELAKNIYQEAINFYQQSDLSENRFGWNEIAIFIELYASADENVEAIKYLKSLSRWVLGRKEESFWEEFVEDDREWDIDNSRRCEVPSYVPDIYDTLTYGDGLPLELRTKLGMLRLKLGNVQEALVHFGFLETEAQFSDDDDLTSLADLFHEVADKLCEAGYLEDALTFYEILKRTPNDEDWSHFLPMGKCYFQVGDLQNAEQSFLSILQHDEGNIAARHELAKLYDDIDKDKAVEYRQEIKNLTQTSTEKRQRVRPASGKPAEKPAKAPKVPKTFIAQKNYKPSRRRNVMEINANEIARQRQVEEERVAGLLRSYETLQRCNNGLLAGDPEETSEWMAAAADLVADFRTCKGLYPYDKFYYSTSYVPRSAQDKAKAMQGENREAAPNEDIAKIPAATSSKEIFAYKRRAEMPTNHLGLSWDTWLNILVQYALCLSREQRYLDAYDVCISAKEAVVYCHVQESMFTIYLCWCTCAVLANDMDTIVSQVRHFMKEYQFTTDAYRLFATLVRLCQSPLSHLTKGPTTKFILRNIKTMDFSLVRHNLKEGNAEFRGMASYTGRDANGKLIVNTEMDICLLLLYGHILFVNTSFGKALHYLFRAYSLDPKNPMINMSVGLGYIQYAIKRQTQYRPYVIMQGISFMTNYYEARKMSACLEEREEAHYNMARTYHMLGLSHLAIPFYTKVLREEEEETASGGQAGREDLVIEAAYNLQTIYAVAGNLALAKAVTEKWLVI